MPLRPARGVRHILADSPGVYRLGELLEETTTHELVVRREIDTLALNGELERFYVGDHVMVKPTDSFDSGRNPAPFRDSVDP